MEIEFVGNLNGNDWVGILRRVSREVGDNIIFPSWAAPYKLQFRSPDAAAVRQWRWGQRRRGRREGWRCRWPGSPDRPVSRATEMIMSPKCRRKTENLCLDIVLPRIAGVVDWIICWHAFLVDFELRKVSRVTPRVYVSGVTVVLRQDTAVRDSWEILFLIRM